MNEIEYDFGKKQESDRKIEVVISGRREGERGRESEGEKVTEKEREMW